MKLPALPFQKSALLIVLFIVSTTTNLVQADTLSPARQIEVTAISGEVLPLLQGKKFDQYSVMVVSNGKLTPIPFQFDDRNEVGLIYVPGGKIKASGEVGVLEEQDELAFMLKDTGPKATADNIAATAGTVIYELDFDTGSNKRYAYVVENNTGEFPHQSMNFDMETGLVKTNAYTLQVDPDNLLVWSDYVYKTFTEERSIIDNMKLRIKIKLGFIKMTISNNLIPSEIVAVKNGPVKSIIEMDASISALGINILDMGAVVQISENSTQFPVFVSIPKAASALSKLDIEISLDFNELEGARVRTALGPKEPVIAGGDGADHKDLAVNLQNTWLSGSSGKNWDVAAFFVTDETVDASLNVLYKDESIGSKPDKPERFKGSHPQVGYALSDIPSGISTMIGINLYYSDDLWQGNNPEKAIDEISNPAPVNATAL